MAAPALRSSLSRGRVVELSVVLPCYRAATLAERSVRELVAFLGPRVGSFEVIVVDDGGGDFPPGVFAGLENVTLLSLPTNAGKGAAVRAGMRAARGAVRVFTDVDLPYDLDLITCMAWFVRDRGYHMVIGDRTLPGSVYRTAIGWQRKAASALFSVFVGRIVTGGGYFDTQCGLKAMRGDVADELFRLQRLDRFAFDVELVYLAIVHRLDVKRIPVVLRRNETSSVRLLRDSTQGFADLMRIKYHRTRGSYRSPELERIVREDFDRAHALADQELADANAHAARRRREQMTAR